MRADSSQRDAAARSAALDPARSFIVQAPAGSGKTGLLTQRFLRLLATVDAPEQILAITFTRKAAAEMRRRVLLALADEAPDPRERGEHAERTRELARAARARGAALGWSLAAHPARLRIQTIDAFCHGLAGQLPLLARAGTELRVALAPRELYARAARATLAALAEPAGAPFVRAAEAARTLLLHRDNQVLQTERLLVDMLARREQWLPLILAHQGAALRESLEADLASELAAHLRHLAALWPREHLDAVCALAPALDNAAAPEPTLEDLPRWRALSALLLTRTGNWRRSLDRRNGLPAGARKQKAALLQRIEALERVPGLQQALARAGELPEPRMSAEQWQVAEALFELLKLAATQLELTFRATGQVDFPAVAQAARAALGGAEAPSELALALDYRIRHLLVDEFQDTSFLQVELLSRLTAGWSPGDGRTLFCVGDPMQSIYRFRQAEVGLFLAARERGLGTLPLEALSLTRNFRSGAALVEWFNAAFVRILPAQDDLARGAARFVPSEPAAAAGDEAGRTGAAVCVHPALVADPATEGVAVANEVAMVLAQGSELTVGILVRQRAHAVHVAAALRERGIAFQAVELEPLAAQPVVRDLLALTRALLHRGDRAAWLALLRSPLCGLSLADLECLAAPVALAREAPASDAADADAPAFGKGPEEARARALPVICVQLADPQTLARLSPAGRTRAQRLLSTLEQAWALEARLSLREWVERTWITLGGPAVLARAAALEDAAAFFERLASLAQEGTLAAGAALEAQFADLFARPDPAAPPRVQIMTIHKAKGLEFDVVMLPGLGRGQSRSVTPLLRWLEVPRADRPPALLLAPIERKGVRGDPLARYLALREEECADFERARLLYVAVTRARRTLHLFGHVDVREKSQERALCEPHGRSLLALLWSTVRPAFETHLAGLRIPPTAPAPPVRRTVLRRLAADWRPPPPAQPAAPIRRPAEEGAERRPPFDWAGEVSRHVGTLVHAELEAWSRRSAIPSAQEIVAARSRYQRLLAAEGVPRERQAGAAERIVRALTVLIADERGRWIFHPGHREVRCELALTGIEEGSMASIVIDRTFVDADGVRWIIDFKTSAHEGADVAAFLDREVERYRPQLERYARLVAGAEPVRLGLYFPLLTGWREWAAGA